MFGATVLARLARDLEERNVVYSLIGRASVWVHTIRESRPIKDIDILVDEECDVRALKDDLCASGDGWYEFNGMKLFGGVIAIGNNGTIFTSIYD